MTDIQFSLRAGEEHSCEPHVQDRQGPQRAELLPPGLQPGGLCGAILEEPTAPAQPVLLKPAPPTPHPAAPHGSQPDAHDSIQSDLDTFS